MSRKQGYFVLMGRCLGVVVLAWGLVRAVLRDSRGGDVGGRDGHPAGRRDGR